MENNYIISDNSNISCISYLSTTENTLINNHIKFNNTPLQEKNTTNEENKLNKRKRNSDKASLDESKSIMEEEYNRNRDEQIYKRLMHLLNKSKFYSNYLSDKINKSMKKVKIMQENNEHCVNDENILPKKKQNRANVNKYNIEEYLSADIKKQAHNVNKRKNLSVEEIEAELYTDLKETTDNNNPIIPKYFHGNLRDYQQTGLQWLKLLYENGINGILADEMGLGKTIQVIALICYLIEKKQTGPYLIIAPLSTISNWLIEFEKFAPDIPVVTFYGNQAERTALRSKIKTKYIIADDYKTLPVVITSFEVPLRDIKFFQSQKWRYVIIDEGHRIKNHTCMLVKVLKTVESMNRLILTGTPLQNNLSELWSLLNFLLPEIFDDLAVFESWFDIKKLQYKNGTEKLLKQEEEKQVLMMLRTIFKPFMLRREKADVCFEIPPKKEIIIYAPLTELQHDLYKAVLNYNIEVLNKIKESEIIIPAEDGRRPKRQCVLKNRYTSIRRSSRNKKSLSPNTSLQETNIDKIKDIIDWDIMKPRDQKNLLMWKEYINVTEHNKDFLINIQISNRLPTYKKIVNHPYLIHCPLHSNGLPKIDEDLVRASGKLLVLDVMLAKLKVRDHKVLLFSTMTTILDMIENYLSLRDYNYVRLDGTTKIDTRKENIYNFNNDSNIFLFLISTRAGGVGLNLASADTVIIYDSDWNPQADIQAMARCHRIGQTKPVVIYKLCTKGTIDEMIIHRSDTKRILEKAIISKEWNCNTKEGLLKLAELMKCKEYEIVTSKKEVFTEMELDKLLDRSDMMS